MAYIYTSPEKANIYIHDFDSSKQVIINDNAYFFSDLLITEYEVDGKTSHIVSVGSEIIIDTSLDDCFFIDGDKVTEEGFIDYLDTNGSVTNCCQTTYDLWKEIHGGTLEDFFAYIKGEQGKEGDDGGDGRTPEFREHLGLLQWRYIGDEDWFDLYKIVDGEDGKDGVSPHIGLNGNWYVGQLDTGIKARGEDGEDGEDGSNGHTPVIGINGNWWINGIDTGLPSRGEKGENLSYDDLTIEQIEEIKGDNGDYYEWRTHDGFFQIKLSQDEDTEWENIYPLPKDAVLPDVFFPDLQARCLATKTEWAEMSDGEKLQIVIDKLCSIPEIKRTGARNYITHSIYENDPEIITCPVGYEYDSELNLCRAVGQLSEGEQLDLILMLDNSGSVNNNQTGYPGYPQGFNEWEAMKDLSASVIQHLESSINVGNVRIGIINFNANPIQIIPRVFDFSSNIDDIYARNEAPRLSGGNTATQLPLIIARDMFDSSDRPDAKKQIIILTDGKGTPSDFQDINQSKTYGRGIGDFFVLHENNTELVQKSGTSMRTTEDSSYVISEILRDNYDVSIATIVMGTTAERNTTKNFYSAVGKAYNPIPSEGGGINGLNMFEAEFTELDSIVEDVLNIIEITDTLPPNITGGGTIPPSYELGVSEYLGLEWDGVMRGNSAMFELNSPTTLEGNIVSLGLDEYIEQDQDYGYTQFIKTSETLQELSVWLVGNESYLIDRIVNPQPNKWYRFEGVRNLSENEDVQKENAKIVIRYKRNAEKSGEVISMYRPVLTHGETIPDWMPSLNEIYSRFQGEIDQGNKKIKHNETIDIQGGQEGEYYHLTEDQHQQVLNLLYKKHTATFNASPSTGEKGVLQSVTLNYNITSNDDTLTSATINQGVGGIDISQSSINGGGRLITTTFVMTINYTDNNGDAKTSTYNTTYRAHIPQWVGYTSEVDLKSYSEFETHLNKLLQANSVTTNTVQPNADYIWFILTNENAKILDQNNFEQSVGAWGNGTSEFYKRSIPVTLQDGSIETLWQFRSREQKTILSNFIYKSV